MYQLTDNPDVIIRIEDGCCIPRGHRWWEEYEAWIAEGHTPDPAQVASYDFNAEVVKAVTAWMDSTVQARGYDSVVSCASYAASSDDTFKAEALAAISWRDAVYRKLYELQAAPPANVTTIEGALALLPPPEDFGWPSE